MAAVVVEALGQGKGRLLSTKVWKPVMATLVVAQTDRLDRLVHLERRDRREPMDCTPLLRSGLEKVSQLNVGRIHIVI